MKFDILRFIRKVKVMPEYQFILFKKEGMVLYNSLFAVKASYSLVGEKLEKLVKEKGNFVILEGEKFFTFTKLMDDLDSVEETKDGFLSFTSRKGKSVVKIEISRDKDMLDALPHTKLNFLSKAEVNKLPDENKLKLVRSLNEALKCLPNTGTSIWGSGKVGLYGDEKGIRGFDMGTYLELKGSVKEVIKKGLGFFLPIEVAEIGMDSFETIIFQQDKPVVLYSQDIQLISLSEGKKQLLEDMCDIKIQASKKDAVSSEVKIDVTSKLWGRLNLFGLKLASLVVKKKQLCLIDHQVVEVLGTIEAKDKKFFVPLGLLKEWATSCLKHKIIEDKTGNTYLFGETASGTELYFILTGDFSTGESLLDEVQDEGLELDDKKPLVS